MTYRFEFDSLLNLFQQSPTCRVGVQLAGLLFHLPRISSSDFLRRKGTARTFFGHRRDARRRARRERQVVSWRTANAFPELKVSTKIRGRAPMRRRSLPFFGWSSFLRTWRSRRRRSWKRKRQLWRDDPRPFLACRVRVLLRHLDSHQAHFLSKN